jgi:general secretion pathway protein A
MYESFYNLKEKPFNLTPDPRFIYFTERHCEALANLVYGIRERKGFLVLTGEVGTGKTTMINALLDTLERAGILSAFIFNPLLSPSEFFEYLLADLNIRGDYKNKSQALIKLNNLLLERYRMGKPTVLIVDEAQNLSTENLEEIRLLTNLETATEKLLQIVLVGQPELSLKLNSPELRQLKQRISLRCNLEPLSLAELKEYISTRMEIAGLPNQTVFAEDITAEIYRLSGGIPRLVNTICDNALLTGYATDSKIIGLDILEEVASDLELSHLPKFPIRAVAGGTSRNWTRTAGNLSEVPPPRDDKVRIDSESFDLFVQFVDKLRENSK